MEIKAASNLVSSTVTVAVKPVSIEQDATPTKGAALSIVKNVDNKQSDETNDDKRTLSESELTNVTDELNNFMQTMNTDIKFAWHSRTNQLMIQVEDSKNHKVLKECPAHEVLDMVAKMRDYVGGLLDKKA